MWLPDTFYNKAPHYWMLLGLLFILFGTYLGFEMHRNYFFIGIGVGLACCVWSASVFSKRARHRRTAGLAEDVQEAGQSGISEQA